MDHQAANMDAIANLPSKCTVSSGPGMTDVFAQHPRVAAQTRLSSNDKVIRVAYLLMHPIQYQTPLLQRLAREKEIELTVFYRSDRGLAATDDPGFGIEVKWDVDLLSGYQSIFLPAFGSYRSISFFRPFTYGLARQLRRRQCEVLWVHGYGYAYHLYACLLGRLLGLKVLVRDEAHRLSRKRTGLLELRARIVFEFLKRVTSCFLAIGSANFDYYVSRGVGRDRISLVPYTVNNSEFSPDTKDSRRIAKSKVLAELKIPEPRTIVLFAGKLQMRKRCRDLVEAFLGIDVSALPCPPLLVVVGEGAERINLEAQITREGRRSDVRFLGFRNQSDLPRLYQAADIFVLPSEKEPWGLVVNEAMSAGCAIIASSEVGASRDLIDNGKNGYTFAAGDVSSLRGVLEAMMRDPERTRLFGVASQHRIANWDLERDVAGLRAALCL
jgi:glycosyltransferase involved in cell wall biosynthesis